VDVVELYTYFAGFATLYVSMPALLRLAEGKADFNTLLGAVSYLFSAVVIYTFVTTILIYIRKA